MIGYWIFRFVVFLFHLMPFGMVYILSDALTFVFRDIAGYRKKVVYNNLKKSFPEKKDEEIKKIASKYYKHLTDIILETLKIYTLKNKKLQKRYKIINPEVADKYYEKGQSIIYAGGHYGNWELGPLLTPLEMKHRCVVMYKPIANKHIDAFVNKMRSRNSTEMVSIYSSNKDYLNNPEPFSLVLLADQNPSNLQKAIWVEFLNQPTACLHGIEAYSKKFNMPVVYFVFKKVRRGYYNVYLKDLVTNPADEPKGAITAKYMKALEKDILEEPAYWLWSHRRWKHKFDPQKYKILP